MADPEEPAPRNRPTDDAGISVFGIETHPAEKSAIITLPAFGEAKEDVFLIVSPKYARLLGKQVDLGRYRYTQGEAVAQNNEPRIHLEFN